MTAKRTTALYRTAPAAQDCQPCRQQHNADRQDSVFDRVHVSYLIRGNTRVFWQLLPTFRDPLPWVFQLQVGRTGDPAGEWVDVGEPQENAFYAIDPLQRVYGKTQWSHYRVLLSTPISDYQSLPTGTIGILNRHDWRIAREIVRKERLRHRLATHNGYLLKRRFSGERCTHCVDLQTDEVRDPDCVYCWGTGYQCGYYYPMSCVWADLTPRTVYKEVDDQGARGTIADVVVQGRMLQIPLMETYDVWVDAATDDRYFVHEIKNVAELRGVPLVADVELRLAAFSDLVYSIPIPDELASRQQS